LLPRICLADNAHLQPGMADSLSIDVYLGRAVRTVLVVDVVESVRLTQENEQGAVARWRRLAERIEREVLPPHAGRLVKSLGDGLLLDFSRVLPAIQAAFAIQRIAQVESAQEPPRQQMLLRVGIQVAELLADERDVYGHGVNLASRLAGLAGPGEIVVSAGVREELTATLDAEIEDLGECYLKHIREPVRAYRLGPPGPRPVIEHTAEAEALLRPTIAVVPFASRSGIPEHQVLGEVLADDIISALSHTAELNVISRLSTTAFRERDTSATEIGGHLHAEYVLSGSYRGSAEQVVVMVELAEARSGRVVWIEEMKAKVGALVSGASDLVERIVARASAAVIASELSRARGQALPTLESYTLLMAAIALMHRMSSQDFARARLMLETLVERVPRQAMPRAWLGKWHVLRVQQGWSDDARADAQLALQCTRQALDSDENCSLALTIDGMVHTNLLKRFDVAEQRYDGALRIDPNNSLAWLLKGTLHAFKGEADAALKGTRRALRLSPLDPHRYFYDSLAATAELSAKRYDRAIELARRSLRANRTHTSTLRALAIAQWQLERRDEARATVAELLRLDPPFRVSAFLERSPSAGYATGELWSRALREAGVPD
jgi:adenylate cyclase